MEVGILVLLDLAGDPSGGQMTAVPTSRLVTIGREDLVSLHKEGSGVDLSLDYAQYKLSSDNVVLPLWGFKSCP